VMVALRIVLAGFFDCGFCGGIGVICVEKSLMCVLAGDILGNVGVIGFVGLGWFI